VSTEIYLPRRLSDGERIYTENELLSTSIYVVVLAEPGGGKTALMESLAQQLGTTAVSASRFAYVTANANNRPLVIDAFDELSKVDNSGIYKLLGT
jgi:predicted NACHT family NTPase